jgi:alpha-aminoadipic semialdehyde synthase
VSLFDYELIVDENGKRLIAFGKFAGRAGLIDFLHGLGRRKNTVISQFMY